jgi:hypothetical protein
MELQLGDRVPLLSLVNPALQLDLAVDFDCKGVFEGITMLCASQEYYIWPLQKKRIYQWDGLSALNLELRLRARTRRKFLKVSGTNVRRASTLPLPKIIQNLFGFAKAVVIMNE